MKKIILAALVSGVMSSTAFAAPAVDAGQGTVTFTGSIIDAACGIAPESTDQTVNLGQIASSTLSTANGSSGKSTPVPFTIKLVDCDLTTLVPGSAAGTKVTTATISFNGIKNPDLADSLAIVGSATGAGVQIIADGVPVKVDGSAGASIALKDNSNELLFAAYLMGDGNDVTPGEFTSLANFKMSYE